MRLIGVKLKNFRCYKDELTIHLDDLSCFIGKNDAGKSSIMEALDIFFNGNVDKHDLSTNIAEGFIEITCLFDNLPDKLVLDSSIETCPKEECLLNKSGKLEIKKSYKVGSTIAKSVFLIAYHPTNQQLKTILSLKNTALKNLAKELGIDLKTAGINQSKNPPIRKAIRDKIGGSREEIEIKLDGSLDSGNNLKEMWGKLNKILPIYTLFKVDKALDDKDKDVQNPMTLAIKEALAAEDIQSLLNDITDRIKNNSTKVADLTLEKLKEIDPKLSEKMRTEFSKEPTWDKIFDLTLLNDKGIPLNKRGSGIRRLVLLSFFRAQAEAKKNDQNAPSIIYAIEEPETSQHPNHQKILIDSFIQLSESTNVQVFFTTHSANLVREIPINSLVYISDQIGSLVSYGANQEDGQNNEETLEKIIKTLGVLPDPRDKVKILLYVEGNNDVKALTQYAKILFEANKIDINIQDGSIAFIIAGGSSLKFYVEKQYLKGLGKPEFHIYDNDKNEYRQHVQNIHNEKSDTRKACNTKKLELENYLTKEAIEEAYADNGQKINVPTITDDIDVPELIAKTLHEQSNSEKNWEQDLSDSKRKEKASRTKRTLNEQAVKKMTIERIKSRSALEEMVSWFKQIKCIIDSSNR